MTASGPARTLALWVGRLVLVLALVLLARRLVLGREALRTLSPTPQLIASCAVVAVALVALNLLLAVAWSTLVVRLGGGGGLRFLTGVYTRTQIAKYLPGNALQFVTRHAMGRESGGPHGGLAAAAAVELLGLGWAASLVGIAGFSGQQSRGPLIWGALGLCTAGCLLFPTAVRLSCRWPPLARFWQGFCPGRDFVRVVAGVFVAYVLFFVGLGSGLYAVAVAAGAEPGFDCWSTIVSTTAVGWLMGFVSPGAPGGLGVREAVMVEMLLPRLDPAFALGVPLLFRLLTVAADGGALALSFALLPPPGTLRARPGSHRRGP
jgi:hypothetical protein